MAATRLCSIPDCGKQTRRRGWCYAHYRRFLRHGDPLGGNIGQGEAYTYLCEVILPYEGDDCLIWPYARSRGYGRVWVPSLGRIESVHRLACQEQNGPPPTPAHDAAHTCGRGHLGCSTRRHLSWKTRAANMADQLEHGTRARGELQGSSRLTESIVHQIRAASGPHHSIAARYGVSREHVRDIKNGKRWAWLK